MMGTIAALTLLMTLACDPGQFNSTGACVDCPSGCLTCFSLDKCEECRSQHYLSGGVCVRCPANCQFCQSEDCEICEAEYVLVDHECVDCGSPGWLEVNGTCQACPSTCATCNSTLSCTTCPEHAHFTAAACHCNPSTDGVFYAPVFEQHRGRDNFVMECKPSECHPACESCSGPTWSDCNPDKCGTNELWSEFSNECVPHCSNFENANGKICLFDYSLRQSEQFTGEFVVLVVLGGVYLAGCIRMVRVADLDAEMLLTLMAGMVVILNYAANLMLLFTLQWFFMQLATLCLLLSRSVQALLGVLCVKYLSRRDDLFKDWVSGQLFHRTDRSCKMLMLSVLSSANALSLVTYEWRKEGLTPHCRQETTLKTLRKMGWYISLVTALIENPVMSAAIIDYIRKEMFPGWFLVFGLMVNWLSMVRIPAYFLIQLNPKEDKDQH